MAFPEAIFHAAFEQAAEPLVVVDGSGLLALWNDAFSAVFRELSGAAPEELTTSFFDFLTSRESIRFDYYAAELFLGGSRSLSVESSLKDAQGKQRWFRFSFSALALSGSGALPERLLLCSMEDIGERVIKERHLLEAKEEAEKATHTKSLFLANMSHEIRTPIQTILGVVELLQETILDGEQSEYAAQVRFSAEVLLGLINDILDFSKIEAGKLDLESTEFDLRACIYQSVNLLILDAHRKGLEVIVDVDEALPALGQGDPARLRQIIVNLFKNAIKFTNEGDLALTVRLLSEGPVSTLRFEVADSGIGIPEDVRKRLFTPFYQADFASARKAGGTGLGLAISRRLVELMGGRIGVEPNNPRGSVFWFEIPILVPDYSASTRGSAGTISSARLLVVDDHAQARAFAARTIGKAGYRVAQASSGEEALGLLRKAAADGEPYQICLVDQNMPLMDGWRLASEITGDTSINSVRLILMVPEGTMGAEAKMKLLRWFNAYVSKPLHPQELLEILSRAGTADVDLPSAEAGTDEESLPELDEVFEAEVLIAEDHEVNRELFTLILSRLGCRVTAARDGMEAVEIGTARLKEGRPFDIVLMDIFMPRMNGYEASQALREAGYRGPLVAVTASALKGEKEKCLSAGMDDILVKPFKKKDLSSLLSLWLMPEQGGRRGIPKPSKAKAEKNAPPETSLESVRSPGDREDADVFDWDAVLETFLGQAETVKSLITRFMVKCRGQVLELEEARGAKDWKRYREIAHSIKGAAWNLSAKRLGNAAMDAEEAGKQGDEEAAAGSLALTQGEFAVFEETVKKRVL